MHSATLSENQTHHIRIKTSDQLSDIVRIWSLKSKTQLIVLHCIGQFCEKRDLSTFFLTDKKHLRPPQGPVIGFCCILVRQPEEGAAL